MKSQEMQDNILICLNEAPVIPLVQADDPETALKTTHALTRGGLRVIEVVLRTEAALDCLETIAVGCPEAIVGAGTVLCARQAEESAKRGARFIVSPGLDKEVVQFAQSRSLSVFPGIATAGEAQAAWNMGLRTVKFFPAGLAGGPKMIQALGSVFRDMDFIPTGGISAENLADFLELPQVTACGGSWLTPKSAITAGNYEEVTRLASQALAIARRTRG